VVHFLSYNILFTVYDVYTGWKYRKMGQIIEGTDIDAL